MPPAFRHPAGPASRGPSRGACGPKAAWRAENSPLGCPCWWPVRIGRQVSECFARFVLAAGAEPAPCQGPARHCVGG
ncbi:hypothetical protein Salmuc_05320 [Salipiger mucosus DSM 16094]|uniref:Uncharacterized protein n=1 Tax=Salipiger mucosus DSM 16094 TaxID=1123237 RepID=S9RUV0_9RHOB|nr:hypothetical protein Salmuc_05320 [Salipiger mucosus DSM 16094]